MMRVKSGEWNFHGRRWALVRAGVVLGWGGSASPGAHGPRGLLGNLAPPGRPLQRVSTTATSVPEHELGAGIS